MVNTFALVLIVLFDAVFGCQIPPWVLKRADPGSSGVSFFNNTVTDSFMMARWTWKDSSGGFWDTRLKVTMVNKEEMIGGGFSYYDQYENELASVRWFRNKINGPIRWKHTSFSSPPDSWWMTSLVPWGNVTWGFKNKITDGSWVFRVGNDTIEPNNLQNVNGWSEGMYNRKKRSLKSPSQENNAKSLRSKLENLAKIDQKDTYDYEDTQNEDFFHSIVRIIMEFIEMIQKKNEAVMSQFG